jgi:hypothetical protein
VLAVLASLAIFVVYVQHGRWLSGLVFALVPVLFMVRIWLKRKGLGAFPPSIWVTLGLLWMFVVFFLYLTAREAFSDQPYHAQLAVTAFLVAAVWGVFDVLATIRLYRMLRAQRA